MREFAVMFDQPLWRCRVVCVLLRTRSCQRAHCVLVINSLLCYSTMGNGRRSLLLSDNKLARGSAAGQRIVASFRQGLQFDFGIMCSARVFLRRGTLWWMVHEAKTGSSSCRAKLRCGVESFTAPCRCTLPRQQQANTLDSSNSLSISAIRRK